MFYLTRLRRMTVAFMVFSLLMTLFSGCSGTSAGNAKDKNDAANAGTQVKEEKKPVLKYLSVWSKDDYNTYPVAKLLEQKTGYAVQYDMLPQDKPLDKLNLIIASGEAYDIIATWGGTSEKAVFFEYAKRGALEQLDSLIDTYGANIKQMISENTFNNMKVDNKIFCIPSQAPHVNPVGNAFNSLLIRQDWLDKLNLKVPGTLEEFTEVLKAFKEKDPDGNGADKNIPFSLAGHIAQGIQGAFGIFNDWDEIDGKLVPPLLNPGYKDYLAYMADLYKQGLLDKELPVNKEATMKEKFTSGRAGVMQATVTEYGLHIDALAKNKPNGKCVFMRPLKGKNGTTGLGSSAGLDRIVYIPVTSKNKEHAVKYLNAKLDKETFKEMVIGKEGELHTVKEGQYYPIQPIFFDQRGSANTYISGCDEKNYPIYWAARLRKDARNYDAYEFLNLKDSINVPRKNILQDAPHLAELSKNNLQLNQLVSDFTVRVIAGAEPISQVDSFIQKWKSQGGDAVSKEVNDWYEIYKKSQK